MRYYSTVNHTVNATLEQAMLRSYAPDGGLYMPERIPALPRAFFSNIASLSLHDIAYAVANFALQGDVDSNVLHQIVSRTLDFPIPLTALHRNRWLLELFHGPSLSFKDIGARFMAQLLHYFQSQDPQHRGINLIVPTSGNTGAAVAHGFKGLSGVKVFIIYPLRDLGALSQAQFTHVGQNIVPIGINGSFEECRTLALQALADEELKRELNLTSAKAINIARLLPHTFQYFWLYAQLCRQGVAANQATIALPCGNLGNLTAGIIAMRMGLPLKQFIAVNNANNAFVNFLKTGQLQTIAPRHTITPAIDIAQPRNLPRLLSLYGGSYIEMRQDIAGIDVTDQQIAQTIGRTYEDLGILLDPHSAAAYYGTQNLLEPADVGVVLGTAHPAKYSQIVETIIDQQVEIPQQFAQLLHGQSNSITLTNGYPALKRHLLDNGIR